LISEIPPYPHKCESPIVHSNLEGYAATRNINEFMGNGVWKRISGEAAPSEKCSIPSLNHGTI